MRRERSGQPLLFLYRIQGQKHATEPRSIRRGKRIVLFLDKMHILYIIIYIQYKLCKGCSDILQISEQMVLQ